MKTNALLILAIIVFSIPRPTIAYDQPTGNDKTGDNNKPNFIVFLTDDQGWGDLGCYGHERIKSPNLDKFATEGLRLTQCYAACSVCSPSRSAILTGRTPYRNGVFRWIPSGSQYHLRTSEITIAEILKERGYDTCHTGKWHLNGHFNSDKQPQPDDHGYDHWLATQNNASPNHMNPKNYVRNGEAVGPMNGPSAVLAAQEAIDWLESRKNSGNPFFLTVWTHEPHLPIESAKEFMKPYSDLEPDIQQHHGNITQLDAAFGKLMVAVDSMGYRDNTFVMFTSDNGPEGKGNNGRTRGSTGGLRGRKRYTHEGGIRVPGIVRWPGKINPGSESDVPVIGSDIFSTICDIVGEPLPTDRTIDGTSIVPLFSQQPVVRKVPMYWRNHLASEQTRVGMRVGDWKIIGSEDLSSFEFYNIKEDWQETKDLKEVHPEKFNELKQKLIAHDAAVLAEGPDWWKNDKQKPKKKKTQKGKSNEPAAGKDETGQFEKVLGTTVTKSDLGFRLDPKGEGLALRKLESPITQTATLTSSFRSGLKTGKTKNGMIVIGQTPTNGETVKLGTAIGMGSHNVFLGDWSQVNSGSRQKASFDPDGNFEIKIELDIPKHIATTTINGKQMRAKLPATLTKVEWIGYYAKATITDFSEIVVSEQR